MSGYQGWTNHSTWALMLTEIKGSAEKQESYRRGARLVWSVAKGTDVFNRSEEARFKLADSLKDAFERTCEEQCEKLDEGPWVDLLTSALQDVCWEEVADDLLKDTAPGYEPATFPHERADAE